MKKKQSKLTRADCGIVESGHRIYIDEDLSKQTAEVFKQARSLKSYGYVWCKNGSVYAKKEEGPNAVKIRSIDDVRGLYT